MGMSTGTPILLRFPQRGEVWYIKFPNQPNDPHQPRTAIVISTNIRNERTNTIIVVPTSSSLQKASNRIHVFLPKGAGGLQKDCWARCDLVTTIDKLLLNKGPLGAPIGEKYLYPITQCIRFAIGDPDV